MATCSSGPVQRRDEFVAWVVPNRAEPAIPVPVDVSGETAGSAEQIDGSPVVEEEQRKRSRAQMEESDEKTVEPSVEDLLAPPAKRRRLSAVAEEEEEIQQEETAAEEKELSEEEKEEQRIEAEEIRKDKLLTPDAEVEKQRKKTADRLSPALARKAQGDSMWQKNNKFETEMEWYDECNHWVATGGIRGAAKKV